MRRQLTIYSGLTFVDNEDWEHYKETMVAAGTVVDLKELEETGKFIIETKDAGGGVAYTEYTLKQKQHAEKVESQG